MDRPAFTKMVQAGDYTGLVAKALRDKEAIKIIEEYIQMLAAGHVKTGLKEATPEQREFGIALLQAVAADIEAVRPLHGRQQ